MDSNLFKHAKLLEGKNPEEIKKFISFLFLTLFKLQHTTSDMGAFFGGMHLAIELFLSFIHNNFEIPTRIEISKTEIGFIDFVGPYVDLSFELFEDWKRKTETYQINKGIEVFKSYERVLSSLYKEYQKRSQR